MARIDTPFLCIAERCPIAWIHRILCIHSFVDGCVGCFHFLAIVNNAVTVSILSGENVPEW